MPSLHPLLCPSQALGVTAKPSHLSCFRWEDQTSHLRHFPADGSSASSDARNCKGMGRGERGQGTRDKDMLVFNLARPCTLSCCCPPRVMAPSSGVESQRGLSLQWGAAGLAPQGGSERSGQKREDENIPKAVWDAGLRWAELHSHAPCTAQSSSSAPAALLPQALWSHSAWPLGKTRTCSWLKFLLPQINTFLKRPLEEATNPPSFSSARV